MRTHREDLHGNLLSNAALPSESGQAGRCRFSCAGILALVPEFGGGSPSHLCGTLNPVSATLRNWSMDLVNRYQTLRVLVALVVVSPLCSQNSKRAQQNSEPTKSDYIKGPHGYEGWTLNSPVVDSGYGDPKASTHVGSGAQWAYPASNLRRRFRLELDFLGGWATGSLRVGSSSLRTRMRSL